MSQTKQSLFDISAELDQIAAAYDALEELGTDDDVLKSVEAYFGNIMENRDAKIDRYCDLIAHESAFASQAKEEADRIRSLATVRENKVKSLKKMLQTVLGLSDITKIETPYHKVWIQANGGVTPLIVDETVNPELLDKKYQKVTVSLNTAAVRADLDAGAELPFAKMGERGSSLRIK